MSSRNLLSPLPSIAFPYLEHRPWYWRRSASGMWVLGGSR